MSVKTQRRQARKAKQARHEAKRAATQNPLVPNEREASGEEAPQPQQSQPQTQPQSHGPEMAVAPGTPHALRETYTPSGAPSLPVAYLAPAVDARGAYVPLADDVRAGMVEAVAEGLLPHDAAMLFGIHAAHLDVHLAGDPSLAFDLERAELAAKLRHLQIINAAPSSERIRAARWYLKVRWPEEFDAVIVSRRVRAALDERRQAQRSAQRAAAQARAEAELRDTLRHAAQDESAATPVHMDENRPVTHVNPVNRAQSDRTPPAASRPMDDTPAEHPSRSHPQSVTAA